MVLIQIYECLDNNWVPRWLCGKESACYAGEAGSSLGGEDPLEEEMATYSSILAWTEEPGGL